MDILLLRSNMITREVLDVLNVLTNTKKLSLIEARNIINLQLQRNHYTYVGYIDGNPVAIGSFVILSKLGNNGGRSALIEDVSVAKQYQKRGYGKQIIKFLCKKAISYNVYKIFLDCSDENVDFYIKCGFYRSANQMRMDV